MIIREATKEDIPRIIVLGKEFAVASQKAHEMSISDEKIAAFANTVVENKFWTVLVMEVDGDIVGMLIAFYSYIFIFYRTPRITSRTNTSVFVLIVSNNQR